MSIALMKPMKFPESCKYMRDVGGVVCWMGNKQDLTFIIRRIKVTVWGGECWYRVLFAGHESFFLCGSGFNVNLWVASGC